jgi:outer membrane protein assembly factor BamB
MPWLRTSLLVLLLAAPISAADWPQWLGPNRDGASTETVPPWKGPLKVLWRQEVGEGHSSPVVASGRVYLHTKVTGAEAEALTIFDAATGKPLKQTTYPRAPYQGLFGNGPRGTPAVIDGRVYTFGISGVLGCFDAEAGTLLWQVDTIKTFNSPKLFFGASCSPLVESDLVLINAGGAGHGVVAFDRKTGNVAWKQLDDGASYSSPIVFGDGAQRQVVFLTAEGLVSLQPATGRLLWRHPLKDKLSESSTTPVRVGDVLVGSSITYGSVGLKLESKDGKPAVTQLWMKPELTCYFSTPVAVGKEHLYLVTGSTSGLKAKATLRCVEAATGKELWQRAGVGAYHASLLRTGDGKLLLLEEKGDLVLLQPDLAQYRELARAKVCGQTWAHPALSDGRLYVRDGKELICVQVAP